MSDQLHGSRGRTGPAAWLWQGEDLILRLRVTTRAKRNQWIRQAGERFRVKIAEPPVAGRANDALAEFLAETFQVSRSAVAIEAGRGARDKRVRIHRPKRCPEDLSMGWS